MTDYRDSKGVLKPIDVMDYSYLCNALAKLHREGPDRVVEIAAMEARKAELEATFERRRLELESEGYFAIPALGPKDKDGYAVCGPDGEPVADTFAAHEYAAWAKAWPLIKGDAA